MLIVVESKGPSLLGRNWLKYIRLDWNTIARVHAVPKTISALLEQHKPLFSEGLGTVEPFRATLVVKPLAKPKFFKPHPVPFTLKETIRQQLNKLWRKMVLWKDWIIVTGRLLS